MLEEVHKLHNFLFSPFVSSHIFEGSFDLLITTVLGMLGRGLLAKRITSTEHIAESTTLLIS